MCAKERTLKTAVATVPASRADLHGGVQSGFRLIATQIWREGGVNAFYAGCVSNILRGMGGSIVLVLYDELTKFYK